MPIKEAALRYSPLMAEAFQKTLTERPATKKSEAVRAMRVAQIPSPMVTPTIRMTKRSGIQLMPVIGPPPHFGFRPPCAPQVWGDGGAGFRLRLRPVANRSL